MKIRHLYHLLLFLLLLPVAALAQPESCPRIWRSGDTLYTDPAAQIQWYRNDAPIPGATGRFFLPPPTERGSYRVAATGQPSTAFDYAPGGHILVGYVFDGQFAPVANASVRLGSRRATTDARGFFSLNTGIESRNPDSPLEVRVEAAGHWPLRSRVYLASGDTTLAYLNVQPQQVTHRFPARRGGDLVFGGLRLSIPPDGLQTEDGTPWTGTVELLTTASTALDPAFGDRFPGGDFMAHGPNGEPLGLVPEGFVQVRMQTPNGRTLELRPEAAAQLAFRNHIPASDAPDSLGFWHYDDATGTWQKEGWGYRTGNMYSGTARDFSAWAVARSAEPATVRGRLLDCHNRPLPFGRVQVGHRWVVADAQGRYQAQVAGGIAFRVQTERRRGNFTLTLPQQVAPGAALELPDLQGLPYTGRAVWNAADRQLNVRLVGRVPTGLRFSVDGDVFVSETDLGFSATGADELTLDEGLGCRASLPGLRVAGSQEGCYKMVWNDNSTSSGHNELGSLDDFMAERGLRYFESFREAVGADDPVYSLSIEYTNEQPSWDRLGQFPCLQRLTYSYLPEAPSDIDRYINLMDLTLNSESIRELPESIGNLTDLHFFGCWTCKLGTLPESIGNLRELRQLHLGFNAIDSLPASFSQLTKLRFLDLVGSNLRRLPEGFSNLKELRVLGLGGNRNLRQLPEDIGELRNLRQLDINECGLTRLPQGFGQLGQLEVLLLANNPLVTYPQVLNSLSAIRLLGLENCQLTDLPSSIDQLADTLRELNLTGNPIPVERRAAIQALLPNTRISW